jgi:hypothetical protein
MSALIDLRSFFIVAAMGCAACSAGQQPSDLANQPADLASTAAGPPATLRGLYLFVNEAPLDVAVLDAALSTPYIHGITAYALWNDVQPTGPTDAVLDRFDTLLSLVTAHGKTLNIGVDPASHTPAWVFASGVPKLSWIDPRTNVAADVPVTWDPTFLPAIQHLIDVLGKYDGAPGIGYVTVSGPGLQNVAMVAIDDPMHLNGAALTNAGYSDAKYAAAWAAVRDRYAARFATTPLVIAPAYVFSDNPAPALEVIAEADAALGTRILYETQHLTADLSTEGGANLTIDTAMRDSSRRLGKPFCLQTGRVVSNAKETPDAELAAAIAFGATWVEVFQADAVNPAFAAALAAADASLLVAHP